MRSLNKPGLTKERSRKLYPHLITKFENNKDKEPKEQDVVDDTCISLGRLRKFLQQYNKSAAKSSSELFAHFSGIRKSYFSSSFKIGTIIIDYGAINHIAISPNSVRYFNPNCEKKIVIVANGKSAPTI